MSSTRKDARWMLATDMLEGATEFEFDDMDSREWQKLLDVANGLLELMPDTRIAGLAARWNSESPAMRSGLAADVDTVASAIGTVFDDGTFDGVHRDHQVAAAKAAIHAMGMKF